MIPTRYAVLVDGAFFLRKLGEKLKRDTSVRRDRSSSTYLDASRAGNAIHELIARAELERDRLLRIYFYDAPPATGTLLHPISKDRTDLTKTPVFERRTRFLEQLELQPDIALRLGSTEVQGWKLGTAALRSIVKNPRALQCDDLVPNITQKGVDLRMGLDLARLALGRLVDQVVVVTGDSDLVPAFRFVRREGLRVILGTLGHGVKQQLKAHADRVIEYCPTGQESAA